MTAPAYRPTAAQARAALSRANRIVWMTWVTVTLVLAGSLIQGRLGAILTAFGCLSVVLVQDDAIKAARLLGHGITNRRRQ